MSTFSPLQKPDNVTQGLNVSYTVPAGKVARVSVVLSCFATVVINAIASQGYTGQDGMNSNSQASTLVLRSGDVLTATRTPASGSSGTGSTNALLGRTSESSVIMTVNGSNSLTVRAQSRGHTISQGGSAELTSIGSADFGFVAEEYFE